MILENSPMTQEPVYIRYKITEKIFSGIMYLGIGLSLVFVIFLSIAMGTWWCLMLWFPMAGFCLYAFTVALKSVEDKMRPEMTEAMKKHVPEVYEALRD